MDVQTVSSQLSTPVTLFVNRGQGVETAFGVNLYNVARQISGVSMNRIRIEEWEQSPLPGKPSVAPASGDNPNVHYFAAPEGGELAPFLEFILGMGGDEQSFQSYTDASLEQLATPCHVMIFIAPTCPHCPYLVRSALRLAVRRPLLTISVVDAVHFEGLAQRYKVKHTPTTIINDGLTLVGRLTPVELAGYVLRVAESGSLTWILESMIKAGRAEDAADVMCSQKQPEAILPIYLSREFSLRMGALVALEAALEKTPEILDSIIDELTSLLFKEDVGLRGDTAELLGKTGNPAAIPALRKAAEDPDPDVREAVAEALQFLENHSRRVSGSE